ncbi:MAG: hypothetical protein L3J88_06975 [Gammaproteobacteria bacterium]|nr:hypothetical protein [Gammaproteobacteria bacterium]
MDYSQQAEKFNDARTCLMLPHPEGEAQSIADAFHDIELGLHEFDIADINEDIASHISLIKQLIDHNRDGKTYQSIAESLTPHQKLELSRSVRELADHFIFLEATNTSSIG